MEFNLTNEGGYNRSIAFLKDRGLWLLGEQKADKREGEEHSTLSLKVALQSEFFKCFIDPTLRISSPGDLPNRKEFCRRTGQYVPESKGEIVRCIYESLSHEIQIYPIGN